MEHPRNKEKDTMLALTRLCTMNTGLIKLDQEKRKKGMKTMERFD